MNITESELARLSYAELRTLNERVVKFMRMKRGDLMEKSDFKVGSEVHFDRGPRRGGWVSGVIVKINKKTFKVEIETGVIPWTCPKHLVIKGKLKENYHEAAPSYEGRDFMAELANM